MAFHGHHLWNLRLWKVAGSSFTKTLQASEAVEGESYGRLLLP